MFKIFTLSALAGKAAAHILSLEDTQTSIAPKSPTTLTSNFNWTSTSARIFPKNDSRVISGIKDPSIVQIGETYHVFASTAKEEGYSLIYFNFTDFSAANRAPFYYLDQAPLGTGYRAAPEVFYFEPQRQWYLVYQNGNAAYSTNQNINDPAGWTVPKTFYNGTPQLIQDGLEGGYWVDMWVICDEENCHLFSSGDNGRLYRSQTKIADFPNGMSDPVIALHEPNKNDLYEASNVYSISNGQFLLLVECIGEESTAGGTRYFRSWTSTDIAGPWETLAATESNPFLGAANVKFVGKQWTKSLSHGEIVRTETDQKLRISLCDMRFLYQGVEPSANTTYNALPWRLGLATQRGGECGDGVWASKNGMLV
ncbi:alpha-L-arab-like proteininofuranosidase precursor [Massarina eburnea CBS 473.64]|uniref:Alpha-L-arabinofuranosidase n=1 Tax=Massarina eburnea CBS 473.64 TaxID=1395130 RepID=A0A6A6RPM1_9PLEO|nr:alpha-L-arab-like proteininofuranosidase precursor [Massarina eburnea CBS 473.64]